VASRLDELGGEAVVAEGPLKVLQVGDKALTVGASQWSGSYSAGAASGHSKPSREDQLRSLYSSLFGHVMMAQFMGTMAWKSTGGAVLDQAQAWSVNQYDYVGLEAFGGGDVSAGASAVARQEIAANRTGALAYEQYGFMRELGYAYYNPALARYTNDAKVAGGVGLAAGIGAWAAGATLGMGMTAATGFATLVGTSAAAVVGIPAALGTSYNLATDQDSYTGWSLKNMLAGYAWSPGETDFLEMEKKGYKPHFENFALFEDYWLELKGAAGIGGAQEEWSQRMYGISAQQYTEIMGRADPARADWLFEGRDRKSAEFRWLTERIQDQTSFKEDVVTKGLSAVQVAFGGLNDKQGLSASYLFRQAAAQGATVESLLSGAGQIAQMRGVKTGTEEFEGLAVNYATLSPVAQQTELAKASRDYQKYAQWVPYLEGGNTDAYGIYSNLGGQNASETNAITSAFANAQMSGIALDPSSASQIASSLSGLTPYQRNAAVQMAAQMSRAGSGEFVSSLGQMTGLISSGGMTQEQVTNLASFNRYEWSDFARANPGFSPMSGAFMQYEDNGLKDGTTQLAGSGVLMFARQRLGARGMTDTQTLNALGIGVGDNQFQNTLLQQGMWGAEQLHADRQYGFQMASIGIGFAQLAANRQFYWGSGTWDNPDRSSSWGISDRIDTLQYQGQMAGFATSLKKLDLGHQYDMQNQQENEERWQLNQNWTNWSRGFDYETSLMRREWTQGDWQYQSSMRSMQFDWKMEDFDEAIRRSSGYERAQLVRQRDRAVQSNNMENSQVEQAQEQQKELWEREDERYQKSIEFANELTRMDEEGFERSKNQREELYKIDREDLLRRTEEAKELHKLQLELQTEQRRHSAEQLKFQEISLGIQAASAAEQKKYNYDMRKLAQEQERQSSYINNIVNKSGSMRAFYNDFINFLNTLITASNYLSNPNSNYQAPHQIGNSPTGSTGR
jgi:hypothetical protein